MTRDKGTLRFALVLPSFQLVLFGLIDTTVKDVPTAVFDMSRSAASREFIESLENTGTFKVTSTPPSLEAVREEIVAHRAGAGIEIPPDFAERVATGRPVNVLVLIDGSDSTVSQQALGAANGLALSRGLQDLQSRFGRVEPSVSIRPQLLFNPDSRSANLLIPGLIAILLTFSATMLSAFAVVRERERGTLEQLLVTPVSPTGLVLGKILPYLLLGIVQLNFVLVLMVFVFNVPVHGSVLLLEVLAVVYMFALLALGLMISSRARTQTEASQLAQAILLPSVMLSGYIFPPSTLPRFLFYLSKGLPATHFITIARGIVIRGAPLRDLIPATASLAALSLGLVLLSTRAFRRTTQ